MSFPVVGDVQECDYEQDSGGELRFPELGLAVLQVALLLTNLVLK